MTSWRLRVCCTWNCQRQGKAILLSVNAKMPTTCSKLIRCQAAGSLVLHCGGTRCNSWQLLYKVLLTSPFPLSPWHAALLVQLPPWPFWHSTLPQGLVVHLCDSYWGWMHQTAQQLLGSWHPGGWRKQSPATRSAASRREYHHGVWTCS